MERLFFMKRFFVFILTLITTVGVACLPAGIEAVAQARPQRALTADNVAPNGTSAVALYEEAAGYVRKKYAEFQKGNVPFDKKLADKTVQEERDLALRNAATLAARGPLKGSDVYYLGLLYHLADKPEGALDAMRRFIAETKDAAPEEVQNAYRVLITQAVKLDLLDEAVKVLSSYTNLQPQKPTELYRLTNAVAGAYYRKKQYELAAPHARSSFDAAKRAFGKSGNPDTRDEAVYQAGLLLADIYLKSKKRDEAVATMQEVRQHGLLYPSAELYGNAVRILERYGETVDPTKANSDAAAATTLAPELNVEQWIDQTPAKLSDLRGQVVLLDFWATWCGPCQITIPKLNSLHKRYKDKGLVILGVTKFEGSADGQRMTPAEEVAYLRQFKKKNGVAYGYAVADASDKNSENYGVSSIPTAVLIDRRGVVRHIITGVYPGSDQELSDMIKKLLAEQ
jgi:thiol-disulfide isomerase/thioredoxin